MFLRRMLAHIVKCVNAPRKTSQLKGRKRTIVRPITAGQGYSSLEVVCSKFVENSECIDVSQPGGQVDGRIPHGINGQQAEALLFR